MLKVLNVDQARQKNNPVPSERSVIQLASMPTAGTCLGLCMFMMTASKGGCNDFCLVMIIKSKIFSMNQYKNRRITVQPQDHEKIQYQLD
jgi:hypothetical protein